MQHGNQPKLSINPLGLANQWLRNIYRGTADGKKNEEHNSQSRSEAAEIVDFMREAWKLPTPNLIISVTGGAALFENISPHIYKLFQQDLVSAAVATSENIVFPI